MNLIEREENMIYVGLRDHSISLAVHLKLDWDWLKKRSCNLEWIQWFRDFMGWSHDNEAQINEKWNSINETIH